MQDGQHTDGPAEYGGEQETPFYCCLRNGILRETPVADQAKLAQQPNHRKLTKRFDQSISGCNRHDWLGWPLLPTVSCAEESSNSLARSL